MPPQQQPALVVLRTANDTSDERVVVDLNTLSEKGSIAADFYVPSRDGKLVAVALSENGSEDSSAHVFETATGKELSDRVPRVNFATAGGSIAWKGDGSGFYYTRYPQGNERPPEDANFYQQVYFHKLGTDSRDDVYVIGKEFPRIAETQLSSSDDGRWLLATVANGDGGQYAHYVMDASGTWTQVTHFDDGVVSAKLLANDALYLLSRKDAPRGRILRLPLADLRLANAKIVVAQTAGRGRGRGARRASIDGVRSDDQSALCPGYGWRALAAADPRPRGAVRWVCPRPSRYRRSRAWNAKEATLCCSRCRPTCSPPRGIASTPRPDDPQKTALSRSSPISFDDAEVSREFAVSKDGTRVPDEHHPAQRDRARWPVIPCSSRAMADTA